MKRLMLVALALFALEGCSYVTSGQPASKNATGEAWYVRSTYVLFIPVSSDVYHCPADNPETCVKARIEE